LASPTGAPVEVDAHVAAGRRHQGAVAVVARPADGQRQRVAGVAELLAVEEVAVRQLGRALDLGALGADAEEDGVVLAERNAEADRESGRDELVLLALAVDRPARPVVEVDPREMPSIVKYGSTVLSTSVLLYLLVLISKPR
jgi:hypothetical protein